MIAMVMVVEPGVWNQIADVWVKVETLHDPLLLVRKHRVTVHSDGPGRFWVDVDGNNASCRVQTVPPDTMDFAMTNGEPL